MSVLVTGSIGIDTVESPAGRAEGVIGGSAVYFALAASNFTDVRMVAVVGKDFDHGLLSSFTGRRIDTVGIEVREGSQTFRWHGKYQGAMNEAETVDVKLNVLAERNAPIPEPYQDSRCVFLANTHPTLQRELAQQLPKAELIVCDTMNLWITNEQAELRKTLQAVHGIVLNDGEARLLTGKDNLVSAAREILKMGPRFVIIKKGENGSLLAIGDDLCIIPAYPTEHVVDPTGAGDTFAGAMMGYLDQVGSFDLPQLRAAMARGSVTASFVLESFSVEAAAKVTAGSISDRLAKLREMSQFE